MDTIGVSQTDFLSGEISMTFDLEKARDAAKFDDRMAITMFPLAIAEIERLRAEISEQKGMIWKTQQVKKEQAAQIKSLEDALVEYLAADIAYAAGVLWSRLGPRKEEYRERARQQLQAGDKIGTGARSPCWQITEDRVTAIDQGLRFLEWSNAKTGHVETKKHIATLQTMLEETGDKNGFEGRNKMRIETIR